MEPGKPWLRTADRLAVALLVAGCGVGMTALLLRPPLPPQRAPTSEELRPRLPELESRLRDPWTRADAPRDRDL